MAIKVYGITNCNTVKKALGWLKENGVPFTFYDLKKKGITTGTLNEWMMHCGWGKLLNKKGSTWRVLTNNQQKTIMNQASAIALMILKPSVIKRPVIEWDGGLMIGFNEIDYKNLLLPKA